MLSLASTLNSKRCSGYELESYELQDLGSQAMASDTGTQEQTLGTT